MLDKIKIFLISFLVSVGYESEWSKFCDWIIIKTNSPPQPQNWITTSIVTSNVAEPEPVGAGVKVRLHIK